MPLDLGDHTALCLPACRLIAEVGVIPAHMERRLPDRQLEQIADPVLQNPVCRKPDRIFDPLGFEEAVDLGIGKARVSAEIEARDLAAIARYDRVEHILPAIGAVEVAGTQGAAFEVVVAFAIGEQSRIEGDDRSAKLQRQSAVAVESENAVV